MGETVGNSSTQCNTWLKVAPYVSDESPQRSIGSWNDRNNTLKNVL